MRITVLYRECMWNRALGIGGEGELRLWDGCFGNPSGIMTSTDGMGICTCVCSVRWYNVNTTHLSRLLRGAQVWFDVVSLFTLLFSRRFEGSVACQYART